MHGHMNIKHLSISSESQTALKAL